MVFFLWLLFTLWGRKVRLRLLGNYLDFFSILVIHCLIKIEIYSLNLTVYLLEVEKSSFFSGGGGGKGRTKKVKELLSEAQRGG